MRAVTPRTFYDMARVVRTEGAEVLFSCEGVGNWLAESVPDGHHLRDVPEMPRIRVYTVLSQCDDYEDWTTVKVVRLDGEPVMVLYSQTGGDNYARFVTDRARFCEMVEYARG
jgi:hypothetical protein